MGMGKGHSNNPIFHYVYPQSSGTVQVPLLDVSLGLHIHVQMGKIKREWFGLTRPTPPPSLGRVHMSD